MILSHPVVAMANTQLCIININGYCIMDIGMVLNLEKRGFNQQTWWYNGNAMSLAVQVSSFWALMEYSGILSLYTYVWLLKEWY